ncbi:hypothetical protein R1flu_013799 [Riccia fluitans]|uniref:RBR-type E3 ubiquitin transferase n=1 Tax=Riccia fluitans TaxID=41844 RepID=A0ABD1YEF5_9MARC
MDEGKDIKDVFLPNARISLEGADDTEDVGVQAEEEFEVNIGECVCEGNSPEGPSKSSQVQRGEESVLRKIIKASVLPPLSTSELESNAQEQADEILALEAIYGEDFRPFKSEHIKTPSFMISIYVEVPETITLWGDYPSSSRSSAGIKDSINNERNPEASCSESSEADSTRVFTVQFLPPLRLVYNLPVSYPSHSPPLFTLSCTWLNSRRLSKLCSSLDKLWDEEQGQVVVYSWVEWLKTQTLSSLGISERIELGPSGVCEEIYSGVESDERASAGFISVDLDISLLLRYNEDKKNEEFYKTLQTCYICFSEHLGKDFVRLPCQHNFCRSCLQTLATIHAKEGSVNKLTCPDTSCRGSIPQYVLKELLEKEVYLRWEHLVLQRTLDSMGDIVYCPRCETVCIQEENNLAQCPNCFYAFCSLCRQNWHIGQECMSAELRLKIFQERQKGSTIDQALKRTKEEEEKLSWEEEEKKRKEQFVMNKINEMMDRQYIRREAKQCPNCKMAISKTGGCNHMYCSYCGERFCFKCGKKDWHASCLDDDEIAMLGRQRYLLEQQQEAEAELKREQAHDELHRQKAQAVIGLERCKPCPNCRQLNVKVDSNNHVICWACRSSFCCLCYKIDYGHHTTRFFSVARRAVVSPLATEVRF